MTNRVVVKSALCFHVLSATAASLNLKPAFARCLLSTKAFKLVHKQQVLNLKKNGFALLQVAPCA